MKKDKIGFAICGSFCTYEQVLPEIEKLAQTWDITPIMSEKSSSYDTRFGTAEEITSAVEKICGKKVMKSIIDVEPAGPKKLLDALVIAPCTGNTIAKIEAGITDSSVTMAAKAVLRNNKPVIIAVSTNDGLSGNAKNIGSLLVRKNIYFVPFYQDDPLNKPTSLLADMSKIGETIEAALEGRQVQPLLLTKK